MHNCSDVQEELYDAYFYIQLVFIIFSTAFLCIMNIFAIAISLSTVAIRKRFVTTFFVSCYIAGCAGTISSASNDIMNLFEGVLLVQCRHYWDMHIMNKIALSVCIFSMLCLSYLRFSSVRKVSPGFQQGYSQKDVVVSSLTLWSLAILKGVTVKLVEPYDPYHLTHIIPVVIAFLLSAFFYLYVAYFLHKSTEQVNGPNTQQTVDQAHKLVCHRILLYLLVLVAGGIIGSNEIKNYYGSKTKFQLRITVWLHRILYLLYFSVECLLFYWKTNGAFRFVITCKWCKV